MTFERFEKKYGLSLNEQQKTAAGTVSGPVLLLAVPGSGKTTVLISRLGYMLYALSIAPEEILTVTYTVAATQDMKKRYIQLFGNEYADRLEFRTINGICAKIIAYYGRKIGKSDSVFELISDDKERGQILTPIYRQVMKTFENEGEIKDIMTRITYIKNMMLEGSELEVFAKKTEKECKYHLLPIYEKYTAQLRQLKKMDYDDQMKYALTILKKDRETLEYFQEKYRYICVDEAQDTSKIQHIIIELLASKYKNIFMVGDEDQSIYGFRAAYPQALLGFDKRYKDARVLLMEENFRSDKKIVNVANRFIVQNVNRHPKNIIANRAEVNRIRLVDMKNRRDQYVFIEQLARECNTETAILYRYNECIIPVVNILDQQKISYNLKTAELTFFTHKTIMDIKNIYEFSLDMRNTELFMQVYYKLQMYLTKEEASALCQISVREKIDILDGIYYLKDLSRKKRENINETAALLRMLKKDNARMGLMRIMEGIGYREYLEEREMDVSKIDLLRIMAEKEESLKSLFERLSYLQEEMLNHKNPGKDCKLTLSTIHSSKGLEYDTVYMLDVIDGIFPQKIVPRLTAKDGKGKISTYGDEEIEIYEEERRIFYVGITRAKNNLCLFRVGRSAFLEQLQ